MRWSICLLLVTALAACAQNDPSVAPADASVDVAARPDGTARPDVPAVACDSDEECSAEGRLCDLDRGVCVGCNSRTDCADGLVCLRHECERVTPCAAPQECPGQVCSARLGFCVDCDADRDCSEAQVCRGSLCVARPTPCQSSAECAAAGLVCDPDQSVCVACVADADCPSGRYCTAARGCARQVCVPNGTTCQDATHQRNCDARGASIVVTECPFGQSCRGGSCQEPACTPGVERCDPTTGARVTCAADASGYEASPCPSGLGCRDGACVPQTCVPGTSTCANTRALRVCNPNGLDTSDVSCPRMMGCLGSACVAWTCTPDTLTCASDTERTVCIDGVANVSLPACTAPSNAIARCVGRGECSFECAAGWGNCTAFSGANCETNTTTSVAHCGVCGRACGSRAHATASCAAGACAYACTPGYADCDGSMANGCEASLSTATDCLACGAACAAGEACRAGGCAPAVVCSQPRRLCGARCVDPQSDAANCGACGRACPSGQACVDGACAASCPTTRGYNSSVAGVCRLALGDGSYCRETGGACADGGVCNGEQCDAWCGPGLTVCRHDCANLQVSHRHCGACDRACGLDQECVSGRCVAASGACASPQTSCPGGCKDLRSDAANCGACGRACPGGQACVDGACAASCPTARGYVNSPAGVCRLALGDGSYCRNFEGDSALGPCTNGGVCDGVLCRIACSAGLTVCGRDCANLQVSHRHCGACDSPCGADQDCVGGRCVAAPGACTSPQTSCAGGCKDLRDDAANCGACGRACPGGQACVDGACAASCPTTRGYVNSPAGVCRPTLGDGSYCRNGGATVLTPCTNGGVCNDGVCVQSCDAGLAVCGRECANLQASHRHCGACDSSCGADQDCVGGRCIAASGACTSPQTSCAGGCKDLRSDAANCGACGRACTGGQACVNGTCAASCPVNQGYDDEMAGVCHRRLGDGAYCYNSTTGFSLTACNDGGVCDNYTCRTACTPGLTTCGRDCANLLVNHRHCGACDNACGSGQDCVGGRCVAASGSCAPPQVSCSGACKELRDDRANCGACGNVCPSGQVCVDGTCAPTCPAERGYRDTFLGSCRMLLGDGGNCPESAGSGRIGPCVGGVCNGDGCRQACAPGLATCNRDCANLQVSHRHCGACNHACAFNQDCVAGVCVTP